MRSIFILLHFHIPCKHIFPYKAAIMAYPKIERTLKMKLEMLEKLCLAASYNIVTVEGAAASRVFFHLKAEAVRMGE